MFIYVFLLFILFPILEISLLIQVGKYIGLMPTVGIIILTALVGAGLARSQGIAILNRLKHELSSGQLPAQSILEGLLIFAAGLLLLTPGFISDAVGLLCLLTPSRAMMMSLLKLVLLKKFFSAGIFTDPQGRGGQNNNSKEIKSSWRVET